MLKTNIDKNKTVKTTFQNLLIGECFQLADEEYNFMKVGHNKAIYFDPDFDTWYEEDQTFNTSSVVIPLSTEIIIKYRTEE